MHFSTKKMGVKFFHRKKTKVGGGGPRGVWQKTTLFPDFFSAYSPKHFSSSFHIGDTYWQSTSIQKGGSGIHFFLHTGWGEKGDNIFQICTP